jgi:phage-related tail protein
MTVRFHGQNQQNEVILCTSGVSASAIMEQQTLLPKAERVTLSNNSLGKQADSHFKDTTKTLAKLEAKLAKNQSD